MTYPNVIYFNEDRGGHIATCEVPEAFASDMRAGFRSVR